MEWGRLPSCLPRLLGLQGNLTEHTGEKERQGFARNAGGVLGPERNSIWTGPTTEEEGDTLAIPPRKEIDKNLGKAS